MLALLLLASCLPWRDRAQGSCSQPGSRDSDGLRASEGWHWLLAAASWMSPLTFSCVTLGGVGSCHFPFGALSIKGHLRSRSPGWWQSRCPSPLAGCSAQSHRPGRGRPTGPDGKKKEEKWALWHVGVPSWALMAMVCPYRMSVVVAPDLGPGMCLRPAWQCQAQGWAGSVFPMPSSSCWSGQATSMALG